MDATTIETTPNKYAGRCERCGAKVPAGAGLYVNGVDLGDGVLSRGALHTTIDQCSTKTKTRATFDRRVRHVETHRLMRQVWIDRGLSMPVMTHVDHPMFGRGDGSAYEVKISPFRVGGRTISVNHRGVCLGSIEIPKNEHHVTDDYRADMLRDQTALADMAVQIIEGA